MPIPGAKYRYKKGTHIRLAFDNEGHVVEAVNTETGATHTPREFAAERSKKRGKRGPKSRRRQMERKRKG